MITISQNFQKTANSEYAYLLTNYHVIRSAASAQMQLADGRSYEISDVVMEKEDVDLAVVLVSVLHLPKGAN